MIGTGRRRGCPISYSGRDGKSTSSITLTILSAAAMSFAGLFPRFVATTFELFSMSGDGSTVIMIHGLSERTSAWACSKAASAVAAAFETASSIDLVCRSIFLSVDIASMTPAYPRITRIRLAAHAIRSFRNQGEGGETGSATVMRGGG